MEPETPMVLERKAEAVNITHVENLLSTLPKELIYKYEQRKALSLSAEVKAYKFSRKVETAGYFVIALCVAGMAFLSSHYFGDSFWGALSGTIVCVAFLVVVSCGAQKIASLGRECTKRLEEFEAVANRISHLTLTHAGITTPRQWTEERIVSYAREVIEAERYFKEVREGNSHSVIQIVHAGQAALEARAEFERILRTAVEFGLSDGDKRPYFTLAQKQHEQAATPNAKV